MSVADEKAGELNLPVLTPTIGPSMIDVKTLKEKTGKYTFDPGLTSTGVARSSITYVDGDQGILLYRGYPIDLLTENFDFLEIAWLLLNGELPTPSEKDKFVSDVTYHTMLHEQIFSIVKGFRRDAHPMAVMSSVVSALAAFYHEDLDIFNETDRQTASLRLIAKLPTIAATVHKYAIGQPFVHPRNDMEYVQNFLHMLFAVPSENYTPPPAAVKAFTAVLIAQADHEQNLSTFTVRAVGSGRANPYACVSAGIASLWGPLHGGANEGVINTLNEIGTMDRIPEVLKRAKDKNDPYRLAGFGHRVYKTYDPRAKVLRKHCYEVLEAYGKKNDPFFEMVMELERIALEDQYFVDRKLYPNVDFYSGVILKTIGIPLSMFTAQFAVARTAGWVAHWNEMLVDPDMKIVRPRQLYVGSTARDLSRADKSKTSTASKLERSS